MVVERRGKGEGVKEEQGDKRVRKKVRKEDRNK